MTDAEIKTFANGMVTSGKTLGYVLGLKRAIDIMREHGISVEHPARIAVYDALMGGEPPPPAAPSA